MFKYIKFAGVLLAYAASLLAFFQGAEVAGVAMMVSAMIGTVTMIDIDQ